MMNTEKVLGSGADGARRFASVKGFYNSLSADEMEFLDVYGFNNVGLTPDILMKVEGAENEKLVLDAVEDYALSVGEEKKRAARTIAQIVDRITG
jgi:hypothetical protein